MPCRTKENMLGGEREGIPSKDAKSGLGILNFYISQ